jgi:uncharacterized protein (DUF1697 family)
MSEQKYISILRGINVSGRNIIKMDALRKLYEELGFHSVVTYVQSGNVLFTTKNAEFHKLAQTISMKIKKEFGFEVPVIVITPDILKSVIDKNPFSKDAQKEPSFFHVTFLASKPLSFDKNLIESKKMAEEAILISGEIVYLYCPNGYGKTKLSNAWLESQLQCTATTRNWKTVNELYKLAVG